MKITVIPENIVLKADGEDMIFVSVELIDGQTGMNGKARIEVSASGVETEKIELIFK